MSWSVIQVHERLFRLQSRAQCWNFPLIFPVKLNVVAACGISLSHVALKMVFRPKIRCKRFSENSPTKISHPASIFAAEIFVLKKMLMRFLGPEKFQPKIYCFLTSFLFSTSQKKTRFCINFPLVQAKLSKA